MNKPWCFLAMLFGLAVMGTMARPAHSADGGTAARPNIVVILLDDAGVETVGAYGGEYPTPNIDRLARDGVRFENAHAIPICTPSRLRLLTGRESAKNYKAFAYMDPWEKTIAHLLKDAGYRTQVVGKWQFSGNGADGLIGATPTDAGFDDSLIWHAERALRGSRYWKPTFVDNGKRRTWCGTDFGPDVMQRRVLEFIDNKGAEPFFIYYSMVLTHDPWVNTPISLDAKTTKEKFSGMMRYTDLLVGQLMDKLSEKGVKENTLVILLGDNGTHTDITTLRNGRPVVGGKWGTTDAGTHIPMIAQWPAQLPAGVSRDGLVDIMDVFPTLAAAARVHVPYPIEALDMLEYMRGKSAEPRSWIFMHYDAQYLEKMAEYVRPSRFVFNKDWKLYGDHRFFDLRNDPLESKPLDLRRLDSRARRGYENLRRVLDGVGEKQFAAQKTIIDPPAVDFPEPGNCPSDPDAKLTALETKTR